MRISLVSPFRTLLNVDTDLAFARALEFSDLLRGVVASLGHRDGVHFETHLDPPPERPFTKYRNLDEVHATWFTTPLASASLDPTMVEAMEAYAERSKLETLRHLQKPTSARIAIHDNTLAVLIIELEFDVANLSRSFSTALELEDYLSDYAASCARYCESAVLEPFLIALDQAVSTGVFSGSKGLLRRPKQFLAFNDLEHHEFPIWNSQDEPSLWTHRIYQVGDLTPKQTKTLTPLLRLPNRKTDYEIGQGTSWLWNPDLIDVLSRLNAACQYFYCMVDALNLSQKRLLRKLADRDRSFAIDEAYARFDRQENMLTEMRNELLDFTTGLQGVSREIFDNIQDAFRTHELIDAMAQRSELLRAKIDRAQARRSLFQQRLLTFSLVLLGAIQIVSLVMQVFNYPNEAWNDDRVPGLSDLASRIPFDLAMNIVLIGIVVFALVWSWRTRRP